MPSVWFTVFSNNTFSEMENKIDYKTSKEEQNKRSRSIHHITTIGRSVDLRLKNHKPNQPSLLVFFLLHNLCVNMGYLEPDFNGMINEPHKNN